MTALPVPWVMPPLPPGWRVRGADLDPEGAYYLGRQDGMDAISIRLQRDEPLAFAWVVLRNLEELRDFLGRLERMTPFMRHGTHIEVKYY